MTLDVALKQIFCCPVCHGNLFREGNEVRCQKCHKKYYFTKGILCFSEEIQGQQRQESILRENVAARHQEMSIDGILKDVANYHCIPVMSERARIFRHKLSEQDWVVDIGCGTGYYWKNSTGANLILCDFAFNNLLVAQKLLGNNPNILYVKTEAACLPIKDNTISGVWSVQVTQHLPESVFFRFQQEIMRIVQSGYLLEIYNFNPAIFHQIIFKLLGKKYHLKGQRGNYIENKLNARELRSLWRNFSPEARLRIFYSEFFFHPNFHMFPQGNWAFFAERLLSSMNWITWLFAEQIAISIVSNDKRA